MSKIDEATGQMGSRPERRLDRMYISKLKRLAGAAKHRRFLQTRNAECGVRITGKLLSPRRGVGPLFCRGLKIGEAAGEIKSV